MCPCSVRTQEVIASRSLTADAVNLVNERDVGGDSDDCRNMLFQTGERFLLAHTVLASWQ
jgi:hypothetical protein